MDESEIGVVGPQASAGVAPAETLLPEWLRRKLYKLCLWSPFVRYVAPRVPLVDRMVFRLTGRRVTLCRILLPVMMVNTVGRRSAKLRRTPIAYFRDADGSFLVVGSNNGLDKHPDWAVNLLYTSEAILEVERKRVYVNAILLTGDRRERAWEVLRVNWPPLDRFQARTSRQFHVFQLSPVAQSYTVGTAPGNWPLIGHALQMRTRAHSFLAGLPDFGDVVRLRLAFWTAHVVCHPDLVHDVLIDDRTFDKGGLLFNAVRKVAGNGLLVCPHADHRPQRRLVQQAFKAERFPDYAGSMSEQIARVIGSWSDGTVIEIHREMSSVTVQSVAATLFPTDTAIAAAEELSACLDQMLQRIFWRAVVPVAAFHRVPTPGNRRFDAAAASLHAKLELIVEDYRTSQRPLDRSSGPHLLALLMQALDTDGYPEDGKAVADQILSVLGGAIEATSSAMTWALLLTSQHEAVRARLHAEADDRLDGRVATWKDLPHLPLARNVVTEVLRLYPPTYFVTRETTRPVVLAGELLPAGRTIIWSPYIIQRRADCFTDPNVFNPDRWADDRERTARNAMVPFGAGARKCVGDRFAVSQAALLLASVAARWKLDAVGHGSPLGRLPGPTLAPRHLRMTVHERRRL